jgi:hypothetical protein
MHLEYNVRRFVRVGVKCFDLIYGGTGNYKYVRVHQSQRGAVRLLDTSQNTHNSRAPADPSRVGSVLELHKPVYEIAFEL